MEIINGAKKEEKLLDELVQKHVSRRKFMRFAGVLGTTVTIAGIQTACKKEKDTTNNDGIDLGSGDVGVLNYAYALEQLEAAFYTQVVASPFSGISVTETNFFKD